MRLGLTDGVYGGGIRAKAEPPISTSTVGDARYQKCSMPAFRSTLQQGERKCFLYNGMSSENSLCVICQEFAEKELLGYLSECV